MKRLRFHDLRHRFVTQMIAVADIVRVKAWMGHADIETTTRCSGSDERYADRPPRVSLRAEAQALVPR